MSTSGPKGGAESGGCFDPAELDRVIVEGFASDLQRARFVTHFGLECEACEKHFRDWALRPRPLPIRTPAEEEAHGPLHDPPRRALLRRRADLRGGFESGAQAKGDSLPFLRLMLAEARNISLGLLAEDAIACVRRAHDDIDLLRRYLKQEGSPPGCPSPYRLHFVLLAAVGLATESVAAELRNQGDPLAAEELRRDAETTLLLSEAGLLIDRYLAGQRLV